MIVALVKTVDVMQSSPEVKLVVDNLELLKTELSKGLETVELKTGLPNNTGIVRENGRWAMHKTIPLIDKYKNASIPEAVKIMIGSIFRCKDNPELKEETKLNMQPKNLVRAEISIIVNKMPIAEYLSLIHICRCRRYAVCRSRWSPYH
eukprot:TRINITY_DN18980_c0_g1_i1.p2 TRINITY_DN18980_c0_g1~~TRINITY_DN18980_c0_g1_i1.p2  ORF type:complete len:149 (+),score=25.21 TRINITY_DN18980_c0_g1_i1:566-1012(+)